MNRTWALIWMMPLLVVARAQGESLYLDRMAAAHWDEREFEETLRLLQEHEAPKPAPVLKLAPFHQQKDARSAVQREFCVECHTTLPHRESERLRSYLNLHVNSLACTSCHFRPPGIELSYRLWTPGAGADPDDTHSLIAPYSPAGDETFTPELPAIARLLQEWKQADDRQKAQWHLRIHAPLEKEGPGCRRCHTREDPLLDLKALDYDAEQIRKIQEDRIARYLGDESLEDQPIKLIDLLR